MSELALNQQSKSYIGFWIYLMTDCVLFASLFATFSVLRHNTFGGPGAQELFSLPYVLAETLILLTSSFTCGLGLLAALKLNKQQAIFWFFITALLGLAFLGLELKEFHKLAIEGNSWRRSGFLSSFFTLVGTHGLHISIGLIWMITLVLKILSTGLNAVNIKRLTLLTIFWHFLDVIWIFIFTIVYMFGAVL